MPARALVLDSEGWVAECCAANLFWRTGDITFTPRLDQAGVNGIMRQFCLRQLAQSPFGFLEVQARGVRGGRMNYHLQRANAIIPIRLSRDVVFFARTLFSILAPFGRHPVDYEKNCQAFPSAVGFVLGIAAERGDVESSPSGEQHVTY